MSQSEKERQRLIEYYSKPDRILEAILKKTYPKDYSGNLIFRAILNAYVRKLNAKRTAAMRALLLKDAERFIDTCVFIYCPKQYPDEPHRPFILWKSQREKLLPAVIEALETDYEGYTLAIPKPREMGGTFLILATFLCYWLRPGANDFLLGSADEERVDNRGDRNALLPKFRYMLYRLPKWMMPKGFNKKEHDNIMKIVNPETGSAITGKASGNNFGIASRVRATLFDEFAYWPYDRIAYESVTDTSRCRILLSAPALDRGTNCFMAELIKSGKLVPPYGKVLRLKITDKEGVDEKWIENERKRRTDADFNANVLGSFEFARGERHFKDYSAEMHRRPLIYNPYTVLYRSWDFGRRHPAVVFAQQDDFERLLVLHLIVGRNVDLETFANYVLSRTDAWFPEIREIEDLCDMTGFYATDKAFKDKDGIGSSVEILEELGVSPIGVENDRGRMSIIIGTMLRHSIEGYPYLMINKEPEDEPRGFIESESCYYMHRAFTGALVTDPKNPITWKKSADTGYDDIFSCLGYIVLHLYPSVAISTRTKKRRDYYQEIEEAQNYFSGTTWMAR